MKPDHQDAEEHHHRQEAEQADLLQHHGPREKERDFEIEQDEQDRHQVVAHVELHARVLEGLEAALVGRELLGIGAVHADQPADDAARQHRRRRRPRCRRR